MAPCAARNDWVVMLCRLRRLSNIPRSNVALVRVAMLQMRLQSSSCRSFKLVYDRDREEVPMTPVCDLPTCSNRSSGSINQHTLLQDVWRISCEVPSFQVSPLRDLMFCSLAIPL